MIPGMTRTEMPYGISGDLAAMITLTNRSDDLVPKGVTNVGDFEFLEVVRFEKAVFENQQCRFVVDDVQQARMCVYKNGII